MLIATQLDLLAGIRYYWSGGQSIGMKSGSHNIQFTYDEKNQPVSMRLDGENDYYLYNVQGDVSGLLDSTGSQVISCQYNSWGKPLTTTDTMAEKAGKQNPFRYRGCCWDEDGHSSMPNWAKAAIGAVTTAAAVGITIATGGLVLPVLAGVAASTLSGAVMGYVTGGKEGAINGAADGFMWGGMEAHHIIEKRLAIGSRWKLSRMPSIELNKACHRVYTNAWRNELAYRTKFTSGWAYRRRLYIASNNVYKAEGRLEMRIKYHYRLENKLGLVKFLDKNQVAYEMDEIPGIRYDKSPFGELSGKMYKFYSFNLYDDQEAYEKFRIQFPFVSIAGGVKSVEYSKAEIESAEWLSVRNASIKVQWEYDESAFRQLCPYKRPFLKDVYYKHYEQKDCLSATKAVKWSTRQFFSGPNAADNIIFCSEKAKTMLENRWKGLEFWPVKKCNTSKYMNDLYQLFFSESLPAEIFSGGKQTTCKSCGRKIIRIPKGEYQLRIDRTYLQDPKSVYKTGDILTGDLIGHTTFSINIVPQDFYRYCEKYKMNRGMIYEPIQLV